MNKSVIEFGKNKGRKIDEMLYRNDDLAYLCWMRKELNAVFESNVKEALNAHENDVAEEQAEYYGLDPSDFY